MSKTIDEKVVEMRFDNKQFEANVQTTLGTLDRLKKSLHLDGATKGLQEVQRASERCTMSKLGQTVDAVSSKFSALETVATGALLRIGSQIADTSERLLRSLTVDNISAGWDKLAQKTTAVGTLVAQGYDLSTVEEQLERLNWFTDETSYNFTDMVSSIAKFTASGQDLEKSVTALEGIANWAALSGQNATTASHAMYQLSQAMGAGIMRKEDYKSIQNVSMDTVEFRQKAIDAAVALGTLKDNLDGTYTSLVNAKGAFTVGQFAEHLTEDAWFTSDVMMKVYNDYSSAVNQIYEYAEEHGITASQAIKELGGQVDEFGLKAFRAAQEARTWADVLDSVKDAVSTGWMTTFEHIFGNYEEQRKLWTDLANILYAAFAEGGNMRNEMFAEAFGALDKGGMGGRDKLIDALYNSLEAVFTVLERVGLAWDRIFPPATADKLYSAVEALDEFTKGLIMSEETGDKFQRSLQGIFAVVDILKTVIGGSLKAALQTVCTLLGMTDVDVLELTARLGDGLVTLRDWIKEHNFLAKAVEAGGKALVFMVQKLKDWFNAFKSMPNIQSAMSKLSTSFGETGVKMNDFLVEGGKRLQEFWQRVSQMDGLTLDNLIAAFKDFRDNVLSYFTGNLGNVFSGLTGSLGNLGTEAGKAFGILTDTAEKAGDKAKSVFGAIGTGIVAMKDKLFETALAIRNSLAGKLGFGEIFAIGIGTSIAVFAMKVAKSLSAIESLIEAITNPLEGLGKLLKSSSKAIDAFAMGMKSEALVNVAKALLMMVGALAALTLLDQSKLLGAVGILAALSAVLAGLSLAVSKMGDMKKLASMAATMVAVGASLLMMAGALQTIANLEGSVLGSLAALGALAAGLVVVCKVLGTNESKFSKGTLSMVAFAASLGLLAKALKSLDGLQLENTGRTVTILVGAIAGLALVAAACKNVKFGGAATLLAAVVSLKLLVGSFKSLAKLDMGEVRQGIAALVPIFTMFSAVMMASKFAGEHASKAGSAIMKMSASLLLIVAAFKIMEGIEPSALTKVTDSVSKIMLVFAAITALSHFAGENATKAGTMLLLMSGAITILSATMVMLAHLKPEGLDQALKAIIALEAVFGALVVVSRFAAEGKKVQVTIITMTACIAGLTAIMAALSMIEPDKLQNATIAITALMGVFGLLMASTALSKKATATILSMAASVALLTTAMAQISTIEPDRLQNAVMAMDALMAGFAVLIAATGLSKKASATILSMGVVVAELAVVLGAMSALNLEPSIQTAASLSIMLTAFSASMVILSKADPLSKQGIVAAMAMGAVVAELAIVLGVLAALNVTPSIEAAVSLSVLLNAMTASMVVLSKADDISMKAMASAAVMGAVIGELAIVLGVMAALNVEPSIETAGALSLLLGAMTACLAVLSVTGAASISGVAAAAAMGAVVAELALVLGAMVALNVQPSIETSASLSLLLISMSAALAILTVIGAAGPAAFIGIGALAVMIAGVGGIMAAICALTADNPTVEADLDRAIMVMEKIGTGLGAAIGGIIGGVLGGVSSALPVFGSNLADFMTNAKPFFDQVKGIDEGAMNGVKALAETLLILTGTNLADKLTSWLTGGTDLGAFADQLKDLGPGLMAFANSVDGINGSDVETAANAAKVLAEFAKSLPNEGGLLASLVGDNSMVAFANELKAFGPALMEYAGSVDGLPANVVENSAAAAKALAEMANKLPNSGGILADWVGDNTLSVFAEELTAFGPKLMEYATSVQNMPDGVVEKSASAASTMAAFANKLPNSGGKLAAWVGDNTLTAFANELDSFGPALMSYATSVQNLPEGVVEKSASAASALSEIANGLPSVSKFDEWFGGKQTLEGFGKQLAAFGEQVNIFATSMPDVRPERMTSIFNSLQQFVNLSNSIKDSASTQAMNEFAKALKKAGTDAVDGFSDAFSKGDTPKSIVTDAMKKAKSELDSYQSKFKTSGSNVAQGFIDGMNGKKSSVSAAGKALGQAAESALKKELGIRSPARALIDDGAYTAKGFEKGIEQGTSGVVDKAKEMASGAAEATKGAFSTVMGYAKEAIAEARSPLESIGDAITDVVNSATSGAATTANATASSAKKQSAATSSAYKSMGNSLDEYYQKKMDWIEEEKYYDRLSLEQELAVYEELMTRYKEGSEERKKIDREIYRLHKELVNEAYQNDLDWIEEEKYYNRLSLAEELAKYEEMQQKYEEGSDKRKKIDREIYRLHKELVQESYQAAIDWIENEKYYDRMTTAEEIAAYKRVRDEHLADAEIIKECDKKLYSLRKQLATEAYKAATTWIDDEKFYDRLNPSEELAALKRLQSMGVGSDDDKKSLDKNIYSLEKQLNQYRQQYESDVASVQADAAKKRADLEQQYADKVASIQSNAASKRKSREEQYQNDIIRIQENAANERANLEKEYADKVTSINEKLVSDIEKLNQDYQNAVESRTDALYKAYALFDEVKKKEEVSATTLMANLQDQVNEFGDWQDVLDQLSARGLDSELMKELQQMGPSAIAEVKALNSMTDDELDKYVALWSIKHAQAREQALKELEGMKEETANQIEQLRAAADKELSEYKDLWNKQMAAVTADAEEQLSALRVTFENDMAEINANAAQELAEYEASWRQSMAEVDQNANEQLDKLKRDFDDKVGQLSDDTEAKIQAMVDEVLKIMKDAEWEETGEEIVEETTDGVDNKSGDFVDTVETMVDDALAAARSSVESGDWQDVGAMAGEALAQGLDSKHDRVVASASALAAAAAAASRATLDEHSPSKVFDSIGGFAGLGLVNGLLRYVDKAEGAADQLTQATTEGLMEAIQRATELVESGQAAQPVIRPILDLSDVWDQAGELNGYFGNTRTITITGSAGLDLSAIPSDAGSLPDTGSENVVSEIKNLRKDVTELAGSVAKLRIVLDSGALVGGIVDPLDNALGQRAIYAERGI